MQWGVFVLDVQFLRKAASHPPVLNRHRAGTALVGVLPRTPGSAVWTVPVWFFFQKVPYIFIQYCAPLCRLFFL